MGTGMLAAEHVAAALAEGRANDEVVAYENAWRDSAVGKDLFRIRNVKPLWSKFGTFIGVPIALAILTFCEQHPSSRWLADLLGGPPQAEIEQVRP